MTDYTKTTDFARKDTLESGDTDKVVKGAEFEVEFDNIATAIATKFDNASTVDINDGNIDNTVIGATTPAAGSFTDVTVSGKVTSGLEIDGGDLEIHTDQDIRFVGSLGSLSSLKVSQPDSTNYLQISTTSPGTYYCRISELGGIDMTGSLSTASTISTTSLSIGAAAPGGEELYIYGAATAGVSSAVAKIEAQNDGSPLASLLITANNSSDIEFQCPTTGTTYVRFQNLPTSDPGLAGQVWNDSGTLKISAG